MNLKLWTKNNRNSLSLHCNLGKNMNMHICACAPIAGSQDRRSCSLVSHLAAVVFYTGLLIHHLSDGSNLLLCWQVSEIYKKLPLKKGQMSFGSFTIGTRAHPHTHIQAHASLSSHSNGLDGFQMPPLLLWSPSEHIQWDD